MTLNDILVRSLQRLGRGSDTQTVQAYQDVFTDYANRAVEQIAHRVKQRRKETVTLTDKDTFSLSALSHGCIRVDEVRAGGSIIDFWQDYHGSEEISCDTDADAVEVIYRFVPNPMLDILDEPEIPKQYHDVIVHYVVACERCGGDPNTQGTSSADFQMFNAALSRVRPMAENDKASFKLLNY